MKASDLNALNINQSFLGYWSRKDLSSHLKQITENNVICCGNIDDFYWGVIGINCLEKKSIASLSVGGFTNNADVWVDLEENTLILGRDSFGRSRLYWLKQEQAIWFSSQLKLLLPLLNNPTVNLEGLYGYCCFSYFPTPYTPVKNIYSVTAGTEIVFSENCEIIEERELFCFRSSRDQISNEDQAISQLETHLKDALQKQISDLKNETVGVCLSGGLDSSLIAALLVKAGLNVRAYTLDFPDVTFSETPYAERVADYLDIPLIKIPITAKTVKKAIPDTVKALDIPFGDSVTVPFYLLYQRAKKDVSVLFNGENGDQLFAGWTNKPILTATVYQSHHPNSNFTTDYLRTFHRLYGYEKQVFSKRFQEQINLKQPHSWLQDALNEDYTTGIFDRFRRASLMLKGAQNIQPRASNLALSQGLKLRSPFCDLDLTQWTFRLSGDLILKQTCEKYILKRVAENWLPSEIVWREKRGMGVPLTQWFLEDLWSEVRQYLSPQVLRQEGCFDSDLTLKIIQGKLGGISWGRRVGEVLWLLLMWEIWRDRVLGEEINRYSWFNLLWFPPQWLRRIDRED
ncbi:MAG: asparagine synthetase B family protein [Halothece sp.]